MNKKWFVVTLICLAMSGAMAGNLEAKVYKYQDLTLQGLNLNQSGSNPDFLKAINDGCWIVGSYYDAMALGYRPFVWRPGVGRTTLPLGTNFQGYANGINKAGKIVGEVYISMSSLMPHYPCLWTSPSALPMNLYVFDATKNSNAAAINSNDQIAGELVFDIAGNTHGARWITPTPEPVNLATLGGTTSSGKSINDANKVAGTAATPSGQRACLWVPEESPVNLAPGGAFSYGNAINNRGNVVGRGDLTPGLGIGHAFFWDHQTTALQDMCPADYESDPTGLSDADEAVGYVLSLVIPTQSHVFYWTPVGGKKDLNKMVVNLPAGVTLQNAKAISPNGKYITGFASNGHPYLLTALGTDSPMYLLLLLD